MRRKTERIPVDFRFPVRKRILKVLDAQGMGFHVSDYVRATIIEKLREDEIKYFGNTAISSDIKPKVEEVHGIS